MPPPPRSNGMLRLARNWQVIYGAQSVTGKILSRRDLAYARGLLIFISHGVAVSQDVRTSGMGARSDVTYLTPSLWISICPELADCEGREIAAYYYASFAPCGACMIQTTSHGLRRGLYSFAASRLGPHTLMAHWVYASDHA